MKKLFIKGTQCKLKDSNFYFTIQEDMSLDVNDLFVMRFTKYSDIFVYKVVSNNGLIPIVTELGSVKDNAD